MEYYLIIRYNAEDEHDEVRRFETLKEALIEYNRLMFEQRYEDHPWLEGCDLVEGNQVPMKPIKTISWATDR